MSGSLRLYKVYYFFYLVCLFFLQLLPARGMIDIPWLFLALSAAPLYFGISYALTGAFFWGIIVGALAFQNKFFHLFIFTGGAVTAFFFSQKLSTKKAVYTACSLSVGALYTVFLSLFGEYPFLKLCAIFIVLTFVYCMHLYVLAFFIRPVEDIPHEGEA